MENPMSPKRKQMQIPGTERKSVPEVEEAAQAYREVRDERCELSRKEKQKKLELLAVMKAHKVKKYKYDDENGEEMLVSLDEREPDVTVRKTGEAESEVGEGVSSGNGVSDNVHPGLIAQAMKAQADVGVEETSDGDVVPPETSAPKAKRGSKKKKSN
jgi:hypothetical protein